MDFLERLLGGDERRRRRNDGLFNTLRDLSKWIFGCGCLLVVAIVVGIALLVAGVIQLGNQAVTVIIVGIMIIAAVASLIRLNMGGA